MIIRIFDIVLLFILLLTVSMIIGYNIVFIIDKKISNVTVNIPPIKVPTPQVTLHVQQGLNGDLRYNTIKNIGMRKIS